MNKPFLKAVVGIRPKELKTVKPDSEKMTGDLKSRAWTREECLNMLLDVLHMKSVTVHGPMSAVFEGEMF